MVDKFNHVTSSIFCIVAYQEICMVFVCLYCYHSIFFDIANIVYFLLHILCNKIVQLLIMMFCNQNDMYFQTINVSVRTIVSSFHVQSSPKCIDFH